MPYLLLVQLLKIKKILIVISPKNPFKSIYVTGNFLYFEDIIKAGEIKMLIFQQTWAQPVVNTMEK